MGRPRMHADRYAVQHEKFTIKRPKLTVDQFHQGDHQCPKCQSRHFVLEKTLMTEYTLKYRTYGYPTRRILWKIRCNNKKCTEPYAVIPKREYWDSAGA